MTRLRVRTALGLVFLAGSAARLVAWREGSSIHPDEFFQVLEPAWWHLHGAGLATWEWREGIRSWVLPVYHGAWMALLELLGVRPGATIGWLLQLHWALVNLVLIAAAFRGGAWVARRCARQAATCAAPPEEALAARDTPAAAGWQGGLLAAALVALFPMIVAYAPHTLSESPSMICFVVALALAAEMGEVPGARVAPARAIQLGALVGLGLCVRLANAPLALVAPLLLLVRRRFALLGWAALGALGPLALFALVDLVTWGKPLGAAIGYLRFNLIEGRAAGFGTAPWSWYLTRLFERAPWGLPVLLLPLLLGLRASWPFGLSAFLLVASLSTQGHKEERFVSAFWPFLIIGAAGVAGGWLARRPQRRVPAAVVALAAALILADGLAGYRHADYAVKRAWMEMQRVTGEQPDLTGVIMESILFAGGSLFLDRPVPQLEFRAYLLRNPMISHALLAEGSDFEQQALRAGFRPIVTRDHVVLLRRAP